MFITRYLDLFFRYISLWVPGHHCGPAFTSACKQTSVESVAAHTGRPHVLSLLSSALTCSCGGTGTTR